MTDRRLDWNAIRPLNGGRDKGFEELCAQLARAETPQGSLFVRKGTPDAGVECYAILADNTEWGWQSKYFDGLGDSQWSQLDESVNNAINKHPQLVKYFICLPFDLSDGRIEGRKSMKMRWDDHVKKWRKWAENREMNVEFVYWGSHEMLDRLAQPQHAGRVRFWFDVRGFDSAWFSARLDESLRTAGPRYTPEIHVDLPIAREFDAIGRTVQFVDGVKSHARRIREQLRPIAYLDKTSVGVGEIVGEILDATSTLQMKVEAVLTAFSGIQLQPIGSLPFLDIAGQVTAAQTEIEHVIRVLSVRERVHDEDPAVKAEHASSSVRRSKLFDDQRRFLHRLSVELSTAHEVLEHADRIANCRLMLVRGAGGTGKTHLLCDVARHRISAGRPTVLLMGQRFVNLDVPWTQALQQLDLPGLSADEFVGALESAAQVAGCRALLLIDAINEGAGRNLWPSHLAAFLSQLEKSQWVSVVISVRSSYEEIVVPDVVRNCACVIVHNGFETHEYDATRTFFAHYGLELPSTPLLAPEFRNPLFLKTLCFGLKSKGVRRLPRGFQGVTAMFDLYLSEINVRLAQVLGFNPKRKLVKQALEVFCKSLIDTRMQWLPLRDAADVVDSLLPNRDFERSLYRGLVVEGALVEEATHGGDADREEIVFFAYERFADHLTAQALLDRYLDAKSPASAFLAGAPLSFLTDENQNITPGLLEALCIQIPERTGQELIDLAPSFSDHRYIGDAFRQSLVWRSIAAFSDGTREMLGRVCRDAQDFRDTLDVLLTVATLPGHPLNATFLDARLRQDTMSERDSWWSIYLHEAWDNHGSDNHGPVDRLVDWASSVRPSMVIEDETVDLCASSLAWMLTTSNRFLRDRSTKALVSLLTGRIAAVGRLVERFSEVDDPYLVERVYATAYGAAMRCHNPIEIGVLAEQVYARIFAAGTPPPHILLRDYARGVVERALYLGAKLQVNTSYIRPPYKSQWPAIPTEEEIKLLLPDWSRGDYDYDGGALEWGRNRIGDSVMDDDFAYYVIGTNSSSTSRSWLSVRLKEPVWTAPKDKLKTLIADFSDEERRALREFDEVNAAFLRVRRSLVSDDAIADDAEYSDDDAEYSDDDAFEQELKKSSPLELRELEEKRGQALNLLCTTLTDAHAERFNEIFMAEKNGQEMHRPPRFELRQIQRYILWRVFDLGWTTARFGYFDRHLIGYKGRGASKVERIGKKYQWIAYHEILALLADNFQYKEQSRDEDGDQSYMGPWQDGLRDIDPSCTLQSLRGGNSGEGYSPSWRGAVSYENWGASHEPSEWIARSNDIPSVLDLLGITNSEDGSQWVCAHGEFIWRQQPPADKDSTDVELRELSLLCTGYLVRAEEANLFVEWAESVDFWGRWMPEIPEESRVFLGEHGWAPASQYFRQPYFGDSGWTQPDHGCPLTIRAVAFEYMQEDGGFDCSIDESYRLRLPSSQLVDGMGLRWSGKGAEFVNTNGRVAAFDSSVYSDGPSALLLCRELLWDFLAREKLAICWTVVGEKRVLTPGLHRSHQYPSLRMSGGFVLGDKGPSGFLKCMLDDPAAEGSLGGGTVLRFGV